MNETIRNVVIPSRSAINAEHEDVIQCLVDCGAHLQMSQQELGETLTQLARQGKLRRLKCFRLAGASLSAKNMSQNSALHAAVETGQVEVVEYLLREGVSVTETNWYGQTPMAIASVLRRTAILELMRED